MQAQIGIGDCGRLSWLLVSFWAQVNIVHRIVSYHIIYHQTVKCNDGVCEPRSHSAWCPWSARCACVWTEDAAGDSRAACGVRLRSVADTCAVWTALKAV